MTLSSSSFTTDSEIHEGPWSLAQASIHVLRMSQLIVIDVDSTGNICVVGTLTAKQPLNVDLKVVDLIQAVRERVLLGGAQVPRAL
jgi:uncharacterized protein YuzE